MPHPLPTIGEEDLLYKSFYLSPCSKEPALPQQTEPEQMHTPKHALLSLNILVSRKRADVAPKSVIVSAFYLKINFLKQWTFPSKFLRGSGSDRKFWAPPAALASGSPGSRVFSFQGCLWEGMGPAPGSQDSWAESIIQVASWAWRILTGSEGLRKSQIGRYRPPAPLPADLTAWIRERKRGHRLSLLFAGQRKAA